ncbi:MAG: class I SAM-dependent methyltransferase, partial [Anaerolineales bacterium]
MKQAEFNVYKAKIRTAIRSVLASAPPGILDEAALPAYIHPNPMINWLFWQRLHKAMDYLDGRGPYHCVLDFGCGSGVMLPFLGKIASQVIAVDVDLNPLEHMKSYLDLPSNVVAYKASHKELSQWQANSFEAIVALDVLEHVKDLPNTLESLLRLLKPGGFLVVSGPTENIFYKISRRLAGRE